MNLGQIKKIYFLGIGGIGMSALARYFLMKGCEVHGYDKTETTLTKKLVKEGMTVHYGAADLTNIPAGLDLVVWTPAIPRDFEELLHFQNSKIPLKKRAEVLGIISRSQRTIAVAGTHGKTTTSSLVTHILRTGGVMCTAFLGGIAQNLKSNYVGGDSDWVVAEADEYDRSFLQLSPEISVLLSMDPDHLDIYGAAENVAETGFKEFLKKTKPNGKVFIKDELTQHFDNQMIDNSNRVAYSTFGLGSGTYRSENVRVEDGMFVFDFVAPASGRSWEAHPATSGSGEGRSYEAIADLGLRISDSTAPNPQSAIRNLKFSMAGRHNIENATAAIAVALQLGVTEKSIRKALISFKGIQRRFEFVYRDERTVFIDDYAHHPTEIRAAVQAARELFPGRHITGIFQPHLYSRTRDFQDGFAAELDKLDDIILMDIYPARELPMPGVTSEIVFDKMKNPNRVLATKANVLEVLKTKDLDVVMTIGAGDIDTFVLPIKNMLKSKNNLH
ncbi:MAG: UDP-N-acetylmuramate--L-alanine ligase [Saprospiraceae bacterium]|nr:UDP-N-acetylmuramate--L-alanine ligase [Saprospiraceae bacterium]